MMQKGQKYQFDTMAILPWLPKIIPVLIELTVVEVDNDKGILRFMSGTSKDALIDGNLKLIFKWFEVELPKIGRENCVLCDPAGFERLVDVGIATLI